MEPITWGALGGFVLFIITVSTFSIKAIKDIKASIRDDMNDKFATRSAEAKAARDLIYVKTVSGLDNLSSNLSSVNDRLRVIEASYASKETLKELRDSIDGIRARLDDFYSLLTRRE